MLLGKRPRPPMKRTTSMTQITFDLNGNGEAQPPSDPHNTFLNGPQPLGPGYAGVTPMQGSCGVDGFDQRLLASVSPRTINRRHSGDFMDTHNHFLRSCALCKRRLVPGHDIYMYRTRLDGLPTVPGIIGAVDVYFGVVSSFLSSFRTVRKENN